MRQNSVSKSKGGHCLIRDDQEKNTRQHHCQQYITSNCEFTGLQTSSCRVRGTYEDFAVVQTHFKHADLLRKECQDTAEHGFGMSAEEAAQDGMTKNMLNLANAMHCNKKVNAGTASAETNACMQQIKNGMTALQQQTVAIQQPMVTSM